MEGTWLRLAGKVLGGVISLYAPSRRGLISIVALRARGSALRRSMGRLCGVRFHIPGEDALWFLLPCGHGVFAIRRSWDACAARSKAGPVMGLRPPI